MVNKKFNVQSRLRSAIRQVWLWSDVHKEACTKGRTRRGVYLCNFCKRDTPAKEKRVDHIDPFTPIEGFKSLLDWGPALVRMFDPNNHQILCVECHLKKTKEENLRRRKYRSKYGPKL